MIFFKKYNMKKFVTYLFMLLFINTTLAQNATPGWLAEKEQLQPAAYLISHFNLNGKVQYLKESFSSGAEKEYYFQMDGKLNHKVESNGAYKTSYEYNYLTAGKIIISKSFNGMDLPKEIYELNEQGLVKSITQLNDKTLFTYDKNKCLTTRNMYTKDVLKTTIKYTYDSKKRLVQTNKNEIFLQDFSYAVKDTLLIILNKSRNADGEFNADQEYRLDASGKNLYVETTLDKKENYVVKTVYNFDKKRNWLEKKKESYPYEKTKRVILYYLDL